MRSGASAPAGRPASVLPPAPARLRAALLLLARPRYQRAPWPPQAQATEAAQPRAERRWQAQLAARHARRQAEAPGRAAADRGRDAARRERKAAFKAVRGPWRWPEWTLAVAVAAFVAFCVLAGASGTHMPNAAGVPLFLIWALGGLIGIPAVLWRWCRARHAAAAMLPGAGQSQASPPGPRP
jgi:hypothetical protein